MSQDRTGGELGEDLPQFRSLALIAAGSNASFGQVDPGETIVSAFLRLAEIGGVIRSKSTLYRTPAFPPGAGPDFVNAACVLATNQTPAGLLETLHGIEVEFGRERRQRWGPRTLDLDLIAYGNQILPDLKTFQTWSDLPLHEQQSQAPECLILPHPRMHERAFVLVPLSDVAPDWRHPVYGRTVEQMLKLLPKNAVEEVQTL